ncbi:MAG: discoidin domain-containing protein [Armatimonadota bacterium]
MITKTNHVITIKGSHYRMVIDLGHKVAITSLMTDGTEWLADGACIYTGIKVDGIWANSLVLTDDPMVKVSKQGVTIGFETRYTSETWQIGSNTDHVNITFSRRFKGDVIVEEQGFPMMSFGQDVVENIRWRKSGGNFWVGGKASAMKSFLAAGSGYLAGKEPNSNIRRAMEDTSFTLLTGNTAATALKITGSTNRDSLDLGAAVEVDRIVDANKKKLLTMAYVVSAPKERLHYATGTEDGSPLGTVREGHVRPMGNHIFKAVTAANNQTDTVNLRFEPSEYNRYFDLGTLHGVNERHISEALNNYGRMMVLDYKYGTTQENPNVFFEVPAFEQHWNAAMGSIMRDDGVMETLKNGLRKIKAGPQAADGHIISPYVWQTEGASWYSDYGDMCLGYVLAIANIFNYTNDPAWAKEMQQSARKALEYEQNVIFDDQAKLIKNMHPFNPRLRKSYNNYWEKSEGAYDGNNSALYYETLMKWAAVERVALKDTAQAAKYEMLAAEVKTALNKSTAKGGMWNEELGALMYGSGNVPAAYLPPNSTALRAGALTDEHARQVVDKIERDNANLGLNFHVMNVRDLRDESVPAPQDDDPFSTMLGENGGWYGAPDGDFYAGYPAYGDRNKIAHYINYFASIFDKTGFINATTWKRDGVTPQDYGWSQCMPHTIMPIWGLYTYAYGFQPEAGRLVIAPFISQSMVGSQVNYRWAKQDMKLKYDGLSAYTLSINHMPGEVVVRFINQTPSADYRVKLDNRTFVIKADAKGYVDVTVDKAGTHQYRLMNPDPEVRPIIGNIALHKPVTASSTKAMNTQTMHWPEKITDGDTNAGSWFAADNKFPAWVMIDLGRRAAPEQLKLYFGRSDRYSLRIEASNNRDNKAWTQVASVSHTSAGPVRPLSLKPKSGAYQYWRVVFTATASQLKANLREWEIGDVTAGSPTGASEELEYQDPGEENYARKAKVEVSSEVDPNPEASWNSNKINDGVRGAEGKSSGWSSAGGSVQNREEWVKLDLGGVKQVGRIVLYPRNDPFDAGNYFPLDYKLMLSSDGLKWTTVADVVNQPLIADGAVTFEFAPSDARYVKLLATKLRDKRNTVYHCQISEFEVMPPLNPKTVRNVALNRPVQVSSTSGQTSGLPGSKAVDGIPSTFESSPGWTSGPGAEQRDEWLAVDLQGEYDMTEFRLCPADNGDDAVYAQHFPVDYKIQTSLDATEWTDMVTVTGVDKPSKPVRHKLSKATPARYVRLLISRFRADGPDHLAQIAEFEAYGRVARE